MKIVAGLLLLVAVGLEIVGFVNSDNTLSAWAFISAYGGAALCLWWLSAVKNDRLLKVALVLVGFGYAIRSLGEWGWLVGILGDDNGYSFIANLPYYLSSLFYAAAALTSFATISRALNLRPIWILAALLGSVLLVAALSYNGFAEASRLPGYWTETYDNVVSAFAAILFLIIGLLTLGGTWGGQMMPLATVFASFLAGNIWYTLIADQYEYGTPPDVFWMLECVIIFLMTLLHQREEFTDDF